MPPPSRVIRATAASSATSGTAASRARAASVASASASSASTARAPTLATATKRKLRTFETEDDNAADTTKQAPVGSRAIKPARGRIARPAESVSKPPTRPIVSSRATSTTTASAARATRPTAASAARSEPEASSRIRGRPRQDSAPPVSTTSTSVDGPAKKPRIAPPVGTRMSAAVNAAAAAAKKSVSFAVPAPEKENVAPLSRRSAKPGAMNSRPMRKAGVSSTTASRSTIAARSTTTARSRIATATVGAAARGRLPAKKSAPAPEPAANDTPLSPRKNPDLNNSSAIVPGQTNEPNPIDSVPLTLRQSPKKNNRVAALLPLTTTGIEGAALPTATTQSLFMSPAKRLPQSQVQTSPQDTIFSPAKRGTHLNMFNDPVVGKAGQGSLSDATIAISKSTLLASPAKRPPSPVKTFGSAAGTSQHQDQGQIVSLLFSPAKRSTPAFKLPSSQFDFAKAVPSLPALAEVPSSPSNAAGQSNAEPAATENEKPTGKPSELLMAGEDTQSDPFRGRGILFRQAPPLKLPSRKNGGAMSAKEDLTGDIFAPVRRGSANSKGDSGGPPIKRDLTEVLEEADDVADDVDDNHDGEIEYTIALTEDDEVTDGVTLTDAQIKISENFELLPRNAPRASQDFHREEDRHEREQSSETVVSAGGSAVGFQEEPEDMMTNVANVSLEFVRSHDREDAQMTDPSQELSITELVQADFERRKIQEQEAMEQESTEEFVADQDTTILLVPEPASQDETEAEVEHAGSPVESQPEPQTLAEQKSEVEAKAGPETAGEAEPEPVDSDVHDEPVQMEVEHEVLPQEMPEEDHEDGEVDEPQPLPQPTPTPRRRNPSRRTSGAFGLRKRELERSTYADSESESEETRSIPPVQRKISGTPAASRSGKMSKTPGTIRRRSGMSSAGFTPLANTLGAWSPVDPHAAPSSPGKPRASSHVGEHEEDAGDIVEEGDSVSALEDNDSEIEATIQLQLESELADEHQHEPPKDDSQPVEQATRGPTEAGEHSREYDDHERSEHRDANVPESPEVEMRENDDADYKDYEVDDIDEDEMELGDDRVPASQSSYVHGDRHVDIPSITASFAEREVEAAIEADIDARYDAYDQEEADYNAGELIEDTADEDEDEDEEDGKEGIDDDDVVGMMNEEDFDDIEVTDEDIALATEADEMSLLEPEDIEVLHRSYQHLEEAMIEAQEIGVYARDSDDDASIEDTNNASAEDEDTIAYEQEPSEEMDTEPSIHAETGTEVEVELETEHAEDDGDVAIDAEVEPEVELEADVSGEHHDDDNAPQAQASQDLDEDSLMSNTEDYYHEKTQEAEEAVPAETSQPVEVDEDGDVSLEPVAQEDGDASIETATNDDDGEHEMTTEVPPVTPVRFVTKEFHTVSKVSVTNDKPEDSITPLPSVSRRKSLNTPRSRSRPQRHSIAFAPTTPGTIIEGQVSPVTPARPQASWSGSNNLLYTPGRINTTALKGVTVFVDVWSSEGNDASGVFIELLTQMGAKCVSEWSWDPHDPNQIGKIGITHVVFKDGSNRTLDKVREAQGLVHCVGVSWVLDCERDNTWVDELPYSVDYGSTPRSTRRRTTGAMRRSPNTTTPARSGRRRSSRRQSTVWERTPTDSDNGFRDDDDDTNWQLSPVAATPAPETVARYASMLPPETPSPMERGGGDKRRDMRALNVIVTPIKEIEEEDGSGAAAAAAAAAQEEREVLIQQTCPPPKRTSSVKHGISWLSPDKEPKDAMIRLLAARRKSLQFAPKVSSPLSKQWKQREQQS